MAKPEVKTALSSLVKRAQLVSSKVLEPLPARFNNQVIDLDEVALMEGLQTAETLTGFHPFGAMSVEEYRANAKDDLAIEGEAKNKLGELGRSSLGKTEGDIHQESQLSVFNTSLTAVVNDIFNTSLRYGHLANPSALHSNEASPRSIRQVEAQATQQKIDDDRIHHDSSTVQQFVSQSVEDVSLTKDSKGYSDEQRAFDLPIFNQLETLVQNWQFSEVTTFLASGDPNNSAVIYDEKAAPKKSASKLDQLTRMVDGYQFNPKSTESSPAKEGNSKPIAGIGESVARNDSHTATTHAFADLMKRNPNTQMTESASGFSEKSDVPSDVAVIEPSLNNMGTALVADSPFAELSNQATQKVADALNDYLREQAELRGVDL